MSIQIAFHLIVLLIAICSFPQVVAQQGTFPYCESLINHCHNQNVPSGGIYTGFSGTLARQRQQWTEFCFEVGMADTCLATIPGECLEDAAIDRIHHIGVCTLEYSDFVDVNECTDDAIIDSQLENCNAAAAGNFSLGHTDACEYLSETLGCANQSFVRHCGEEFGTFFSSMYTRATVLSTTSQLPTNCPLLFIINSDRTALPASVEHCQEQIQDCFKTYTPEFLELVTEIPFRMACSNLDRLKSCFSRVTAGDGDCENLIREEIYYYDYICGSGHSVNVLNESIECLNSAARQAGGCDLEESSFCLAYENFQECYEKIIKRKCSLMYEDVAIDLAAVVEIPPVMHFLPENCPLLDRLPVPRGGATLRAIPWMSAYITMAFMAYVFADE